MLPLLVLSLLAGPVEYIVHEGAHYLVASAFGAHPTLHFDHVDFGETAHVPALRSLLITAAGPAADWAVGIPALIVLARHYSPLALVLAIWVARPLQFSSGLLGMDLPWLGMSGALVGADEETIAQAVGLSARQLIVAELALATPLLLLIVSSLPTRRRAPILAVLAIGVLAGWAGWLACGPYLLP
jgi:hypothetical protein